jgi:predicted nucleic acid-binding protein
MIAVSDTSPLNYLVFTDCIHILPAMIDRVVVPQAVFDELSSTAAPEEIRLAGESSGLV